MLTKKTAKNQITLPKDVARLFPEVEYFEVIAEGDHIVLVPLRRSRAGEVRAKLAELGVTEDDIDDAVAWARGR